MHDSVCLNCETIEDVVLEQDLDIVEKTIFQIKNFKVLNHSLESASVEVARVNK